MGARRVMDAVMEGHKSTLSSGKMVALAAGLSVGATVGYIVYRHISSPNNSKCLPLRCYTSSAKKCLPTLYTSVLQPFFF